ncbi:hypothetical protein PAHAL_2G307100 [Panicum hallii]|jgi:hypothetical protein|uniref:Uncharacterized protein n=1 Tax=Panicum hallii TaxID=206008 RepID=A0A2S3H0K9_9POAL|nr:hypothetical protein PAHAL_2G307100 [Panicum hallii]
MTSANKAPLSLCLALAVVSATAAHVATAAPHRRLQKLPSFDDGDDDPKEAPVVPPTAAACCPSWRRRAAWTTSSARWPGCRCASAGCAARCWRGSATGASSTPSPASPSTRPTRRSSSASAASPSEVERSRTHANHMVGGGDGAACSRRSCSLQLYQQLHGRNTPPIKQFF